jgi:hypothetical protein
MDMKSTFWNQQMRKTEKPSVRHEPKHDYFLCFAGNATCFFCFRFKSFSR